MHSDSAISVRKLSVKSNAYSAMNVAITAIGSVSPVMIVLRQPMRVAMALISTMVFLGGIYGLLGVHFIAAFQVLIYVGAVMVFMVYVIMLLDVRDPSFVRRYSRMLLPGVVLGALLAGALGISAIKLGAPNLPGDTMKITGAVKKKDEAAGLIEVEVAGRNAWGDHVAGTVVVALPRGKG